MGLEELFEDTWAMADLPNICISSTDYKPIVGGIYKKDSEDDKEMVYVVVKNFLFSSACVKISSPTLICNKDVNKYIEDTCLKYKFHTISFDILQECSFLGKVNDDIYNFLFKQYELEILNSIKF